MSSPGTVTLAPAGTRGEDLVLGLLAWYDANARELPWRGVADPYAVWVSEVMLQQTRVETVREYFARWMERFPTLRALARADEEDVLRLWSGLGYYSRARNLHRGAKTIVERFDGRLPPTASGLSEIPGIGPYTAGAIASIAFGERVPAVDGNVLRVLARLDADERDITRPLVRRDLAHRAAALVPTDRPGDWNQAVMDLGATVCTPRSPRCPPCPLTSHCMSHARGLTETIPRRASRPAPRVQHRHFAFIGSSGRVLLTRNPEGLLGGLWSLPGAPTRALLAQLLTTLCPSATLNATLGKAEHRFTHRLWHMTVHGTTLTGRTKTPDGDDVRWFRIADLADAALSTAQRKCLALAGIRGPSSPSGS